MRILYVGNKLAIHGNSPTSIDVVGLLFEKLGHHVLYSSSVKNKGLRILDMIITFLSNVRKIDYVLIDTYSTANFFYALIISQLCRLFNVKYIPMLRGGDLPNRLKRTPFICGLIFKNAYINIAPSNYLYEAFKKEGYTKLKYIPNILEIHNYSFKKRKTFKPKLLWVRSFASIYNPKMAVDVLCQLKQKYPKATLCMVGPDKDGSLVETKKYAESLNIEVEFTGGMTKEAWIKKSIDFDVFINTTHFDNTPVSVMEAMALGLPVVSTNVGGIPYLLENKIDSLLVEDGNVDQMVLAIESLIESPTKSKEIALNARKKVEKFDWVVIKNKWFELFLNYS